MRIQAKFLLTTLLLVIFPLFNTYGGWVDKPCVERPIYEWPNYFDVIFLGQIDTSSIEPGYYKFLLKHGSSRSEFFKFNVLESFKGISPAIKSVEVYGVRIHQEENYLIRAKYQTDGSLRYVWEDEKGADSCLKEDEIIKYLRSSDFKNRLAAQIVDKIIDQIDPYPLNQKIAFFTFLAFFSGLVVRLFYKRKQQVLLIVATIVFLILAIAAIYFWMLILK